MNLIAAIPTRSNWQMLEPLTAQLSRLEIPTILYDNGHESEKGRAVLEVHRKRHSLGVLRTEGWPFYRMWNHAWELAHDTGADAVALLNDDIEIHDESLGIAYDLLMSTESVGIVGLNYRRSVSAGANQSGDSQSVSGSFRSAGIGGHAFLIKASLWGTVPAIDEGYVIWYGDDDLFANVKESGYLLLLALGAPVNHFESTTISAYPEVLTHASADKERFELRHQSS